MTPRISLVTAAAAAALAVGVPAALADPWGADQQARTSAVGSPDLVERAVAARQNELATMLDSRERSLGTGRFGASRAMPTERPLVGDGGDRFTIDPKSHPSSASSSNTVTDSSSSFGHEIEWPQVGLGVVLGIVIALGLMLVPRTTRGRQVAR